MNEALETFLVCDPDNYEPQEGFPKYEELSAKVPSSSVKTHFRGFQYADVTFFRERLNAAFGIGGWSFIITSHGLVNEPYEVTRKGKGRAPETTTTEQEYQVQGYIVSPYLYAPVFGVGMATVTSNHADPRSILSTAFAIAKSEALKNAGQQLGIAPNLRSGEQNDDNIADEQEGIKQLYDNIVEVGVEAKEKADAIITKFSKQSLVNGALAPSAIREEELDNLREALINLLGEVL